MKLSFVIPCYGSEKTIEAVVDEIVRTVAERPEVDYEIVPVNDCSPDNVWQVMEALHARNAKVKPVALAKNMNRPGAVMAGLTVAEGDVAVILDDDGQCPVDHLWDLLAPLDGDYDVSMAKYPERKQSLFKDFGTQVNRIMTNVVLRRPNGLEFTNFMAMKRYIVDEILKYPNSYPYMTGLLLRTTKYLTNVEMEERNRFSGKSNFTFVKMLELWMNGLTAFSVVPLRIATFAGIACSILGFFMTLWVVVNKLVNPGVPIGYSSVMAALFFIGGMIMMMLGVIGEYIGRTYISINKSPQFVIRRHLGGGGSEK